MLSCMYTKTAVQLRERPQFVEAIISQLANANWSHKRQGRLHLRVFLHFTVKHLQTTNLLANITVSVAVSDDLTIIIYPLLSEY